MDDRTIKVWTIIGGITGIISMVATVWVSIKELTPPPSNVTPINPQTGIPPASNSISIIQRSQVEQQISTPNNGSLEINTQNSQEVNVGSNTVLKNLENRFAMAAQISSTISKDQSLAALAKDAAANDQGAFAIKVAKEISSSILADQVFALIANRCSENRDFTCSAVSIRAMSSSILADRYHAALALECNKARDNACTNDALGRINSSILKDQVISRIASGL